MGLIREILVMIDVAPIVTKVKLIQNKLNNRHPSSTFYVVTFETVAHHRILPPHLRDADKLS